MPTYEYECTSCNEHFEVFQRITEAPISVCPKCSGKVNRLIGRGAGIIFKGPGFYATDYKKGKSPEAPASCPLKRKEDGCKSCPMEKK